ncbi:hypothetical protein G7Z17_g13592 [Cylindrodendrum hubeiense]|uniref:Uncharacterized protein n=1 Tax=Cylindrodendrum hubeiense TaxID=595255 RepID=A0A9P5GS03_9HYPO|nr:hypothetical protein G7Z17_g13592 [Cylindrodendrum hubeiense]
MQCGGSRQRIDALEPHLSHVSWQMQVLREDAGPWGKQVRKEGAKALRHRDEEWKILEPVLRSDAPAQKRDPLYVGQGVIPHLVQGMRWLGDMVGLPILDKSNALETTNFQSQDRNSIRRDYF